MATREKLAMLGGHKTVPDGAHRPWPEVLAKDRDAVMAVLDRRILSGSGSPEITALQREYAKYLGVDYCLALNNGTAALHCCAAGLGLQPGDEVIVPAYTFIASAHGVAHQGATPVFCDIDRRSYNLDPSKIEERVSERTKAILAVHIHGQPADMDEIQGVANRCGLAVIEDIAQAHGVLYKGRKVGTLATCAGGSLQESKNFCAGEGGVFVTNDEEVFLAARRLSIFGEDGLPLEVRTFWSHGLGWNYRAQELSCAFARSQLHRLDRFNATAQANGELLTAGLSRLRGITPPFVADDRGCSYWKYMVQLDADELGFTGSPTELRDRVMGALRAEGVEAMIWQPQPLPALPAFRRQIRPWHKRNELEPLSEWDPAEFPVASMLIDRSLSLGSEAFPLYVQDTSLMEGYVEAFEKVLANLDVVLSLPFNPVTPR